MIKISPKGRIAKVAAVGAALLCGVSALSLASTTPVSADPPEFTALVGVGSDTTQDVMNALSGFNQGTVYPKAFSDSNPRQTIASFDALPPSGAADGCITTKLKEGSWTRPNGSSGGQRALSRALDGTAFGPSTNSQIVCSEGAKPVANLVDFARSSSGPASTPGTVLQFVPFARDGLSYGYVAPPNGSAAVTNLTRAQLTSIYTNGSPTTNPTVVNNGTKDIAILPCGIQTSSGTYGSWNTAVAANATQEDAATAVCRTTFNTASDDATTGRIQENHGIQLNDKATVNTSYDPDGAGPLGAGDFQVIVGFSASNFVAQSNGKVTSQLPNPWGTVRLGGITEGTNVLGLPYSGTTPPLTPNSTFYDNGIFGREVYNVLSYQAIRAAGNTGIKEIFLSNPTGSTVGSGQPGRGLPANHVAVICRPQFQSVVNDFGFTSLTTANRCGTVADATLTAPSRSGTF